MNPAATQARFQILKLAVHHLPSSNHPICLICSLPGTLSLPWEIWQLLRALSWLMWCAIIVCITHDSQTEKCPSVYNSSSLLLLLYFVYIPICLFRRILRNGRTFFLVLHPLDSNPLLPRSIIKTTPKYKVYLLLTYIIYMHHIQNILGARLSFLAQFWLVVDN